jgi:hypothetical protein
MPSLRQQSCPRLLSSMIFFARDLGQFAAGSDVAQFTIVAYEMHDDHNIWLDMSCRWIDKHFLGGLLL